MRAFLIATFAFGIAMVLARENPAKAQSPDIFNKTVIYGASGTTGGGRIFISSRGNIYRRTYVENGSPGGTEFTLGTTKTVAKTIDRNAAFRSVTTATLRGQTLILTARFEPIFLGRKLKSSIDVTTVVFGGSGCTVSFSDGSAADSCRVVSGNHLMK